VSHPMQETKSSVGSRKQVLYDQPSISIESFAGCPPHTVLFPFSVLCHLSSMAVGKINNDTPLQLIRVGNSPAESARNLWAQPHESRPLLCPV
jgi:hypothetical protein